MNVKTRRTALLFCSVALAALSGSVVARPVHHHRHHAANAIHVAASAQKDVADRDMRYSFSATVTPAATGVSGSRHHGRGRQLLAYARAQSHSNSAFGGFTNDALVSEARKYIGTNPTGRGSLWCGAFMDMVLKRTGHPGGGNLAIGYEHYGTRVSGPQVGAIAVMGRRGGGHVGVVSGIDANGNPIIVSGNHNHTVAESVYPRGRIAAYRVPGN
jgi:uncharacterized protein (TIGR02594 family)